MKITRSKSAFTLIEIMIVVMIASIIIAIAVPNLSNALARRRAETCKASQVLINTAVAMWAIDEMAHDGDVPSTEEALKYMRRPWRRCGLINFLVPAVGALAVCPVGNPLHALHADNGDGGDSESDDYDPDR